MGQVYDSLPPAYRTEDARQSPPLPLQRYLSLVGDQLDEVATLIARGDEIANPDLADEAWLPWLAQVAGVRLNGLTTVAQRRAAIRTSGSGWLTGTLAGIVAAVRSTLTNPDTGYVTVTRDLVDPWLLHVTTRATETPDPAASMLAVDALGAKPAGVILDWTAFAASWDQIEAGAPTWDIIEALGSWSAVESIN